MTSQKFEHVLTRLLYQAFNDARKYKLGTINEHKFEMNFPENLARLKRDILNRKYHPSRGVAFVINKPVIREIFAAPFRDRVVHHLIILLVEEWWNRHFIYDSYSCRKEKGGDLGIRRLYHHMRVVSNNFHDKTYVLKFDIQAYFNSLPKEKLYKRAVWGVEKQFLGPGHSSYDEEVAAMLKYLWYEIIFDEPTTNVTVKGTKELWKKLPKNKSLFYSRPGTGIVIGNLTSQVLSNVYLDLLDRYITITLGYKHYGRYVDDFYLVLAENELDYFRKNIVPQIESYLTGLGLRLHPKKRFCAEIWDGVPFLGAKIYPYHVLPDRRVINNYYTNAELIVSGVKKKGIESAISYHGRMSHFDAQHLEAKIYDSVGWSYTMDRHSGANSRFYTDPKMIPKK